MKLTKSKISKLYNKTRQSLKRYKKRKSSYKKRTFRKRKVNLARKSLKRFNYKKHKGGWGEVDTPKEEIQPLAETPDQPTTEQSFEYQDQSFDNQPVAETPDQPTTDETFDETSYEPVTETLYEPVTETSYEPVTETSYEPVTEIPYKTSNESIGNNQSEELPVKNLEHVANYIADLVADKVSNISLGEKPQEGFQAINKAVETIASSGGSRKTRNFRLTNKNKTRHI
jgi:hypothetical protein